MSVHQQQVKEEDGRAERTGRLAQARRNAVRWQDRAQAHHMAKLHQVLYPRRYGNLCLSAADVTQRWHATSKWTVPARGPSFGLNASKTCAVVMPSPSMAIHTAGGACASCHWPSWQRGAMTTTCVSTVMIHERRGSEPYKPGVALAGTP